LNQLWEEGRIFYFYFLLKKKEGSLIYLRNKVRLFDKKKKRGSYNDQTLTRFECEKIPNYDSFLFGSAENNVIMRKNRHWNKVTYNLVPVLY
jgi:hypothetical protein